MSMDSGCTCLLLGLLKLPAVSKLARLSPCVSEPASSQHLQQIRSVVTEQQQLAEVDNTIKDVPTSRNSGEAGKRRNNDWTSNQPAQRTAGARTFPEEERGADIVPAARGAGDLRAGGRAGLVDGEREGGALFEAAGGAGAPGGGGGGGGGGG